MQKPAVFYTFQSYSMTSFRCSSFSVFFFFYSINSYILIYCFHFLMSYFTQTISTKSSQQYSLSFCPLLTLCHLLYIYSCFFFLINSLIHLSILIFEKLIFCSIFLSTTQHSEPYHIVYLTTQI